MTPLPAPPRPARSAAGAGGGAMDASGPPVCGDMTEEVASSVMVRARSGYLLVGDEDGRCGT
ncbi:hypothetical protein [Streptomyces hygroscopicus]|uniref:hypothetical protein n=1 Tax=Streptomyces hygroscopicus TaxID=1912 RepID=UPI0037A2112B